MLTGAANKSVALSMTRTGVGAVKVLAPLMCEPETLNVSRATTSFFLSAAMFATGVLSADWAKPATVVAAANANRAMRRRFGRERGVWFFIVGQRWLGRRGSS